MTVHYQLTNEDFLQYQLYSSDHSRKHKNRKFRSRILIPIIWVVIGVVAYIKDHNQNALIIFLSLGIVWYFVYPIVYKWRMKNHFLKKIEKNYRSQVNKPIELFISKNTIIAKDSTSETKIYTNEIDELIELKNQFLIVLNSGSALIVPKSGVENTQGFIETLSVNYKNDINWEW